MSKGSNPVVNVGDVLIDSSIRQTWRVTRIISSSRVEVTNIGVQYENSKIMESATIARGIASGKIKRV